MKMVKRDEFLLLLESCCEKELILFINTCRPPEERPVCLLELLGSCSKKQLDHAWEKIYSLVSSPLLGIHTDENQNEDVPEDLENLKPALEMITCLVAMVNAMIKQNEVYIPEFLYQTAVLLQGVLTSLPQQEDRTRNAVASLFEDWWKKNLPHRDNLIITSVVYLVKRSLDLQPKPLIIDVKRVWSLHDVLPLIDLQNESSFDFKELLRRCFISQNYVQQPEGVRFLGYIMSLDENFTESLHRTIKSHLLSLPRSWCECYGEIYFRAWQQTTGGKQEKLEQNCIQDLMYHAVHAHHTLLPALKKILSYIHHQKKQRGVDEMLCRLYEPIIWRALRVANCEVRYNAAVLFFDVFPMQNPELNVGDSDQFLQKQFDLFMELLYDPYPNIRSLSVTGVLQVIKAYWEVIPPETLKNLIVTIIQDLLADGNSSDVRQSVIKGLTKLLDNPLSHPFLKPILPEVRHAFHDVSEKVRLAMLELLVKVKTLRTIKYWNIVPVDQLLARLVIDQDPVNRRIVKLLLPSFVPLEEPGDVQLERCSALIKSNPTAARQLFKYASQMVSIDETVNYITLLCKALLMVIKRTGENGHDAQSENEESSDSSDEDLKITNTPLMLGFCEIILLLWTLNEPTLKKASHAHHKKTIEKKFSYALPEMLHSFSDPQIVSVLIQIAGHLPANYIPTISRTWVPKLRNMTSENTEDDYSVIISAVCEVGRAGDLLELVSEWLSHSFEWESEVGPSNAKVCKKKKKVGFVEEREPQPKLALDFLSFILQHQHTQDNILRDHIGECGEIRDVLKGCKKRIEQYLTDHVEGEQSCRETFLQDSFLLYCKLCLLLHSMDNKKYSCLDEFLSVLSWVDKHVLSVLEIKEELETTTGSKRPLQIGRHNLAKNIIQSTLTAFNNMLLVGIGGVASCTQLVDFCTACLASDTTLCLLSDVLLCLYQVTEYIKFVVGDSADNSCTSRIIPNALSRVLVSIASYVKQTAGCHKLLSSVRGHVLELLKAVFTGQSPDDSVLPDVMATICATILAELVFYSSQYDLEDDYSPLSLPPLTAWLLDILQSRPDILRFFVQEVSNFVDSEDINGLHNVHGAVHLLGSLTKCKHNVSGLKTLWTVLQKKTQRQLKEQTEDEVESNSHIRMEPPLLEYLTSTLGSKCVLLKDTTQQLELITAIETKLKAIDIA